MKKFLKTVFWLAAPVIVWCVTATVVEWQIFRRAVRQPQATIGITGDSLIHAGINPEFFPEIANFAQATTQPVIWRAKLDVLLDENPQINTFIIEMWSGILTKMWDLPSTDRAQFSRGWGPLITLYDIYRTKEMGGMPNQDFARNFIRGPLWVFLRRCRNWSWESELYPGYDEKDCLAEDTDWWKNGCVIPEGDWGTLPASPDNAINSELTDILDMLKARGIRIVILTPPLMKITQERVMPPEIRAYTERTIRRFVAAYDAIWINCLDDIPDSKCFQDAVHLNATGAEKLTRIVRNRLLPSSK